MNKQNRKLKALVLSTAMAALLLLPQTSTAQYDESRYGLQPWFGSSVMGRESGGDRSGGSTLGNEAFGATGSQIDNEPFGVPIGGGIGILLAAGMGYAFIQSKKNKQN